MPGDDDRLFGGVGATSSRTIQIHTDHRARCWTCGRLLFIKATRPWAIQCRCKTTVESPPEGAPLPVPPPAEQRGARRRQSVAARAMSEDAAGNR